MKVISKHNGLKLFFDENVNKYKVRVQFVLNFVKEIEY